ncbi:MAG: glycoside hydrolase family 2 TIM barrel-domain containing protein [Eubacteriales bacterium]|nr:glycoside hydrolase family 2 TIM barrel-domain containing protein [Eubacteriales bacterium]
MRLFEQVNENWKFAKLDGALDSLENRAEISHVTVNLPHTWNNWDGQDGGGDYFRGKCEYTKRICRPDVPADYEIWLEFEGANSVAEVYADGEKLAEHRGGYSTFRVNLTEALKDGSTMVSVIVDNKNHSDVYPQMADFTFYGGIYRNVNLIAVPKTHFCLDYYGAQGVAFSTKIVDGGAQVALSAWVAGAESADLLQFVIEDEDGNIAAESFVPACGDGRAQAWIPDAHLWQGVEDPYLYTVTARIIRHNECLDEVESFLGVREFYVDPEKGFFLNGVQTPLRGVSRHQDMLGKGNALTADDHWDDAEMIAELGANTVRLAHYQHNQEFYDACDALGLVVWAEIPFISIMNKDPKGHENCREQMKELIYQNFNHPSICFWGISNEITIGGDLPGLQENLEDLNRLVKEIDSTRLTTMAQVSMLPMESGHNQVTDVLSYNHYFGWYGGSYTQNEEWFDKFHAMHPERPFGISEYGCEGIISWHSDAPKCRDYSEEYQAEYHEHLAKIISERPYLWATHIWNMFDFGCDSRDEGGVKGRNNKGLVTLDRKIKKDSYFIYKAYWSKEAFVYITGRRYSDRPYSEMDVKVYSNQPEVTLYVDGKAFETLKGDKVFLFHNVPLADGFTRVTAGAPGCASDSVVFRKVDEPNPGYVMPPEEDAEEGDGAKNWFDDINTEDAAPELTFNEGYFSIQDTVGDILDHEQAGQILVDAMNRFSSMKVKRSMLGMMAGLRLEDMTGMMGGQDQSGEMLKRINAELQKVAK